MTESKMPMAAARFSVAAIRAHAGEAAFARGSAYASQARVRLISVAEQSVRAEVTGTEVYAVVLTGRGDRLSGECECPAFEDRGFCKHLVAVALTVNAAAPSDLAAAEAAHGKVRSYLLQADKAVLADRLISWAERDRALWRQLQFEAALACDDDEAVFLDLTEAIDEATDIGEYVDWRGAGSVAEDLASVIDKIEGVIGAGRIELGLRALDRLFEDAEDILAAVDDSDGEVSVALGAARDLHLKACLAAPPGPIALAEVLFEREVGSDFDLWDDAHGLYADVLGPAGLAEYRRLVEEAYGAGGESRGQLREMLDLFAEREGDVDARIALRARDASSPSDYLRLAQLCHEAGRQSQALSWAEEGLWRFEDRPDLPLIQFAAHLWRENGDADKAQALLWAAFERSPRMDLHRSLMEGAVDRSQVVDRSASLLKARIGVKGAEPWSEPNNMLVEIYLEFGRTDDAWAAARAYDCRELVLKALTSATEESHPDYVLKVYADLIDRWVGMTNQGAYEEAARYIARMARIRSRLGRNAEHAAHVEALALRHKAKRNFIRLLRSSAAAA